MHRVLPIWYTYVYMYIRILIHLFLSFETTLVATQKRTEVLRHMPEPSQETYTL